MVRNACLAALGSLALLVGGCGDSDAEAPPQARTIGAALDEGQLCTLVLGESTADDVQERFGPAPLSGAASDQWLLQYVFVDEAGVVQESTLFWVDGAGVLQKIDRVKKPLPACLQP
jgi:hypothetical protein